MVSNCSTWDLRVAGQTVRNTSKTTEGRLEICYNRQWYFLTPSYLPFTVQNEKLICHNLGYEANTGECVSILNQPLIRCWCCSILINADSDLYSIQNFRIADPTVNLPPLPLYLSCQESTNHLADCVTSFRSFQFYTTQVGVRCVPGMG